MILQFLWLGKRRAYEASFQCFSKINWSIYNHLNYSRWLKGCSQPVQSMWNMFLKQVLSSAQRGELIFVVAMPITRQCLISYYAEIWSSRKDQKKLCRKMPHLPRFWSAICLTRKKFLRIFSFLNIFQDSLSIIFYIKCLQFAQIQ